MKIGRVVVLTRCEDEGRGGRGGQGRGEGMGQHWRIFS